MPAPLVILLVLGGAAWGLVADRIAARWPEHEDGSVRERGWRTGVTVLVGAVALGALPFRFDDLGPGLLFGAYVVALVLLLATDLDQRLLPHEITLPAIPIAIAASLLGLNPLVPPGALLVAIGVTIAIDLLMAALAIPFGAGALGRGDLTLLLSVGPFLGAFRVISAVIDGAFAAGIVIVVLLVMRRITLRSFIPYGPFLVIGALWALLVVR